MKNIENKSTGITLIALVVTIIVLLILAGISVSMITGNNNIILNAGKAKEQTEVANEKELIGTASIQAINENKFGIILQENLQKQLDNEFGEENKAKVYEEDEDFSVLVENRLYKVDKEGNVEYQHLSNGEKVLTIQCVNSVGTILEEKQYITFKDTYSKQPPVVENYEIAEEGIITGEITESKTIQVLYYLVCNDDKTLIFSGLDASGNITTEENDIVSYMIGTDFSSNGVTGSGFVDQNNFNIKSIVIIPETYKGKPVTKLEVWSLGKNAGTQIVKIKLCDNLTCIEKDALFGNKLTELTLGKNINTLGVQFCGKGDSLKKIVFNNNKTHYTYHNFADATAWVITEIGENNTTNYVEDNVLYSIDKKKLIKVPTGRTGTFVIPETVENIDGGLGNCSKITEVVMNNTISSIPAYGFRGCSSLSVLTIGESVTNAGTYAFFGCSKLKTVIINSSTIAGGITAQTSFNNMVNVAQTIYIREDIVTIGSYITSNFSVVTSDRPGYVKYVKNE